MDKKEIDLYRAIDEMRRISRDGGTFSMKFRKWNRDTGLGGGIVTVNAARIRPAAHDEKVRDAGHKLFYTDTGTGAARNCWQPLIVEFNGMRTRLGNNR